MFCVCSICRLTIMNEASKKNMMSIKGMISMRHALALDWGGDSHFSTLIFPALTITSTLEAAVSSSNCSRVTLAVKKLNGNERENGDAQTAGGGNQRLADPARDRAHRQFRVADLRKARISPVTVPSKPSSGASVTSVSITVRNRPARSNSMPAANCSAPSMGGVDVVQAAINHAHHRVLRTLCDFNGGGDVAIFQRGQHCSSLLGSRRRLSRSHQKARSPTTATATRAQARIGHMTGPPFPKNSTTILAIIIL